MKFYLHLTQSATNSWLNTLLYYITTQRMPFFYQLVSHYLYFRTYGTVVLWKDEIQWNPLVFTSKVRFFSSFNSSSVFHPLNSGIVSKVARPALSATSTLKRVARFTKAYFGRTLRNSNKGVGFFFSHKYFFKYGSKFWSPRLHLFTPFVKVEDFYLLNFRLPKLEWDGFLGLTRNKALSIYSLSLARRYFFLNLLLNLSKQVRVRNTVQTLLSANSSLMTPLLRAREVTDSPKRHPIFSKQLSFLNNFHLKTTSFSSRESVKSQFLGDFYDTFTYNYGNLQVIEYNFLDNYTYWDHRFVLLNSHFNNYFFSVNQFRQYLVTLSNILDLEYIDKLMQGVLSRPYSSRNKSQLKTSTRSGVIYKNTLFYSKNSSFTKKKLNQKLELFGNSNAQVLFIHSRRDQRRRGVFKNTQFTSRLFGSMFLKKDKLDSFRRWSVVWGSIGSLKRGLTFDNRIQQGKFYRFCWKMQRILARQKEFSSKITNSLISYKLQSNYFLTKRNLTKPWFRGKWNGTYLVNKREVLHRFLASRLVSNFLKKQLYRSQTWTDWTLTNTSLNILTLTKLHLLVWFFTLVSSLCEGVKVTTGLWLRLSKFDLLLSENTSKAENLFYVFVKTLHSFTLLQCTLGTRNSKLSTNLFLRLQYVSSQTNFKRWRSIEDRCVWEYQTRLNFCFYSNLYSRVVNLPINNIRSTHLLLPPTLTSCFVNFKDKHVTSGSFWQSYISLLQRFLRKYKRSEVLSGDLHDEKSIITIGQLFSNQIKRKACKKYTFLHSTFGYKRIRDSKQNFLPYLSTIIAQVNYWFKQSTLKFSFYKVLLRTKFLPVKYLTVFLRQWITATCSPSGRRKFNQYFNSGYCSPIHKGLIARRNVTNFKITPLIRFFFLFYRSVQSLSMPLLLFLAPLDKSKGNFNNNVARLVSDNLRYKLLTNLPPFQNAYSGRYYMGKGGWTTFLQPFLRQLQVFHVKGLIVVGKPWVSVTQTRSSGGLILSLRSQSTYNKTSKSFFQRLTLESFYNISFIFSNMGFLFITSPNMLWGAEYWYDQSMTQARINSHRYSFFYKNDLKRIYMRKPGFLKILTSFQNDILSTEFNDILSYTFLKKSFNNLNALPYSTNKSILASKYFTHSVDIYRSLRFYQGGYGGRDSNNTEYTIKRIRFKPGYQRIWRKARAAINFTLNLHFRYQIGLTKKLTRLKNVKRHDAMKVQELRLYNLIMSSQFTFDRNSTYQLIASENVFVNGNLITNPTFNTFVGDFIQLAVSLRYYITYKWLVNWSNYFSLKFTKLLNFKNNSSRLDLSKQTSSTFPQWIFHIGYRRFDIPNFLEVDYFTLSTFIIYEPLLVIDYNSFTHLDSRVELYTIYNWKFIT